MSEWILRFTGHVLFHGSLVVGLAFFADRLLLRGRVSAQVRYVMFVGVLVLFLVPGFWEVQLQLPVLDAEAEGDSALVAMLDVGEISPGGEREGGRLSGGLPMQGGGGDASMVLAWFSLGLGWSVVWAFGVLVVLWQLHRGRRRMREVIRASRGGDGVLWTDEVGPCATGCRCPVVLVPEVCRSFSEEELGWILAHERSHISRGDLWVQLGQQLMLAVLWFHPLVWWTNRHINRLRELAVDGVVTRGREDRSVYCEVLLRVASMRSRDARELFWGAGLAMASGGASKRRLEERIRNCLSSSVSGGRGPGWGLLALVLPVLLLGVPGGCQTDVGGKAVVAESSETPETTSEGLDLRKTLESRAAVSAEALEDGPLVQVDVLIMEMLKEDVPENVVNGQVVGLAELEALTQVEGSDVLSVPRVLTRADMSAMVVVGRKVPVPVEGSEDLKFLDVGISLEVTPAVNAMPGKGAAVIGLDFELVNRELEEGVVHRKELASTIMAESGTTVLVGRMEDVDTVTIEDASWLGVRLSKSVEKVERTTLIFVTPVLLTDANSVDDPDDPAIP